ncbi:MAG TPA: TrkA family potassium uptake protein [Limnochordia bacterium]
MSFVQRWLKGSRVTRQFAVLGLGRFGGSLAVTLVDLGHEVLGIDLRPDPVQDFADRLTHVVQADTTDAGALRSLGLRNFDVAVVSIGALEPSILTTMMLKEIGVERVVAKATSEIHGRLLSRVGADRVVFPERDMGVRLAHNLTHGNLIDYLQIAPGYRIVEFVANDQFAGKTLLELNLRARLGITVLVIKHGEQIRVAPGPDDVIHPGDVLVAVGPDETLAQLEAGGQDAAGG